MLLEITTTQEPATDLGYLLHKNPARCQSFELSFGRAHVFYPEASETRCTAALLLDVDPVGMVRGGARFREGLLDQYVNDRPYVASSFMSVAIAQVFGSAMSGRCKERPELADAAIALTAKLSVLPCRGGERFLERVFGPLGYEIQVARFPLDGQFPDWGESPYFTVTLAKMTTLHELLTQLYVLIPVFDHQKHYFVGADEMEKLLTHGAGWLSTHPEREAIAYRFLKHAPSLARQALAQLEQEEEPLAADADASPGSDGPAVTAAETSLEERISLNEKRIGAVLAALRATGARRVLDLGCGEGTLLRELLKDKQFEQISGLDVSIRALEIASSRLRLDQLPPHQKNRVALLHGSLMYRDRRLNDFDAAAVVEVIEHLDPPRLAAFERVLFECARPASIVLTTVNREYNALFENLPAGKLRHPDHRFEWTRAEFRSWVEAVAGRFGYAVRFLPVGPEDPALGSPTQMARLSLVVLIGPSGSGKSTFARKHFLPTEVLCSDACRAMVADDENDQTVTNQAFEILHFIAAKRLAAGKLAVVDATNVQPEARKPLVALAREYHCLPVAIVFDLPEKLCQERNRIRPDRDFGAHVIRGQISAMRRSLRDLQREGFRHVFVLKSPEQIEAAAVTRVALWNDRREETGPFDIIGDLHGCCDELEALLRRLGYEPAELPEEDPLWGRAAFRHPAGRKAVFLGDLVDRGPRILDSLRLVRNMVQAGAALCVPGNHDMKLLRKLGGKDVQVTHGLAESLREIGALPEERSAFAARAREFLDGLVSHYVLDGGRLVVAHAGMRQEMQGRGSGKVRDFALYGETTGETDEFGLPVRYNWAAEYRGPATVVYGHTPVPEPEWLNRTVNIDTGCVFGGSLTALRYPEKEFVAVEAARVYCEPAKPFLPEGLGSPGLSSQQIQDDLLDAEDVIGKRIITTRLRGTVIVREENATAALEVMSRFAANPKWLIYLPPTMSPCETSQVEGLLEHPAQAFDHYRSIGVPKVVCEQKHMGSRAVVVVCRDGETARERFGVTGGEAGIVYTRTGRRFFDDLAIETEFLSRLRRALDASDFWSRLDTSWACLDCELMPWSAKALELLKTQYAAVGAAGSASLPHAVTALRAATLRAGNSLTNHDDITALLNRYTARSQALEAFIASYRRYCWPVTSLDDLKLAPFHIMATEGKVHADQDHAWHMETIAEICRKDVGLLLATPYLIVDVTDPASENAGTAWWEELTGRGGEGMVVKPWTFVTKGNRGLAQPAVKVRGREYLRIIYGPEYTAHEHIDRLRTRSLATKRSLAIREFALGIEALERFVRREPLRRVHECVFGVLAMESEPVDPRL